VVAQQPPSPAARRLHQPSWLDLRLVSGVVLVLASVLLGAKVVAGADRSVEVWALAHDAAAGTVLTSADLRPARVRLFDTANAYLRVIQSPAGRTLIRSFKAGELLPRSAVVPTPAGAIVSIPVQPGNAPGLARGQLIDVWSTVKGCAPVQVLSRVPVQDVHAGGGGALSVNPTALQVIVRVSSSDARRVIAALGTESTIRLVVVDGDLAGAAPPGSRMQDCGPRSTDAGYQTSPAVQSPAPSVSPVPTVTTSAHDHPAPTSPVATPTSGSR
jgi:SAF domain